MTPREQLDSKLDELTEAQLKEVLRYVEILHAPERPDDYDPDNDPMIGFIKDEVDFDARDAKRILYEDITLKSGWTQKRD